MVQISYKPNVMNKFREFILLFLFVLYSISTFSQITVSNVKSKKGQDLIVEKPEPYDSLKTWEYFNNPIQYKRYIGQRVYLPKSSNDLKYEKSMDGYGTLKMGDNSERPFLFTLSPRTVKIDTENILSDEMLNINYAPSNISKGYHATLKLNSIFTNVYKPFLYYLKVNPYSGEFEFNINNNNNTGNKYYQIIDVILGEKLENIMYSNSESSNMQNIGSVNFTSTPISGRKNKPEEKSKPLKLRRERISIAYVLKEEITGDTVVYCKQEKNRFILVSFFVKQKQIYEGNSLINKSSYKKIRGIELVPNSKWLCESVTVSASTGKLTYVLKNEKGDVLTLNDIEGFVLEEDVLKEEAEKKILAQEREEKRKEEEQQRKENERLAAEKRKETCIKKFGPKLGLLIAQGKVQIGMTKEMCEVAWGKPILINKTTSEHGTSETWHFGFIKTLYFNNDILKRIDE